MTFEELPIRKIIHVDMDAFYASVEQMDDPELKGKPIAVGGGGDRGVVSAASYEARKFGVRSAMSGALAKRKCGQLIFVKPRFERYKEISNQIRVIFNEYSELVEPLSLDEAFIDVTDSNKCYGSASLIALEIRKRIYEEVGLTASAGISINKFTAKVAAEVNKPNGQKTVPPEEVISFLEKLPIDKFYGVGKVTEAKMKKVGIYSGWHLKQFGEQSLIQYFGKSGKHFYQIVRGIHLSEVKSDRIRKSLASETTFIEDLTLESFMLEKLSSICEELNRRLEKNKVKGRTITLKIKFNDFTQITRSKTVDRWLVSHDDLFPIVTELLQQESFEKPVRLLGVSMTKLNNEETKEQVDFQLKLGF